MSSERPKRPSTRSKRAGTSAESEAPPTAEPSRQASTETGAAGTPDAKSKRPRVSARRNAPPKPDTTPTSSAGTHAAAAASPKKATTPRKPPTPRKARTKSAPEPTDSVVPPSSAEATSAARVDADDEGDAWAALEPESRVLAELTSLRGEPEVAQSGASRLAFGSGADRRAQDAEQNSAQSLLASDYYERQYGAHGMRSLSAEVDDYGLDPHVEEQSRPWLEALCTRYFRLELEGAQRIPAEGRALLVCNRSGAVPWDGLMLRTALRMKRDELKPLRWLCEDSVIHYPFLGTFLNRLGAVRACFENAERLLSEDRLVAAFPEGAHGSRKLFKDRYRLQRFGRGGYVKLALKLSAPILPTAIIGAEETNPLLGRFALFGRSLGPITPTFPWLGPAGLLPAPVKWRVIIGEPVDLSGYGPEAADDALVVHRLNEQIRSTLQALIDQAFASRRSVLFG